MKPQDIVVGQRYINPLCFGTVYLGVGERRIYNAKKGTYNYSNKKLAIIEGSFDCDGSFVKHPRSCRPGFWDSFKAS